MTCKGEPRNRDVGSIIITTTTITITTIRVITTTISKARNTYDGRNGHVDLWGPAGRKRQRAQSVTRSSARRRPSPPHRDRYGTREPNERRRRHRRSAECGARVPPSGERTERLQHGIE